MSEHNKNTINMYNSGGAIEYLRNSEVNPETEKWEKLFGYIAKQLYEDKEKRINVKAKTKQFASTESLVFFIFPFDKCPCIVTFVQPKIAHIKIIKIFMISPVCTLSQNFCEIFFCLLLFSA